MEAMTTAPDWSALPGDLVNRVADCFLATNDVDYYMDLRAVCRNWRGATADPKSCDPRFRPCRRVLLPEDKPFGDDEIGLFVNTSTGRFVRKRLSLLRRYHMINTITGCLLVLADRDREAPHTASVLNPFTGSCIRFKAPVPSSKLTLTADVVGELPILVMAGLHGPECDSFCFHLADPDSENFSVKHTPRVAVDRALLERHGDEAAASELLVPLRFSMMEPRFMTVEIASGEVVLVERLPRDDDDYRFVGVNLYRLCSSEEGRVAVERIDNIGGLALFLGLRCLSIDADKFSSVQANCVYYRGTGLGDRFDYTVYMYDLAHGTEVTIDEDVSHPYTLIQLLSNYTVRDPDTNQHLRGSMIYPFIDSDL